MSTPLWPHVKPITPPLSEQLSQFPELYQAYCQATVTGIENILRHQFDNNQPIDFLQVMVYASLRIHALAIFNSQLTTCCSKAQATPGNIYQMLIQDHYGPAEKQIFDRAIKDIKFLIQEIGPQYFVDYCLQLQQIDDLSQLQDLEKQAQIPFGRLTFPLKTIKRNSQTRGLTYHKGRSLCSACPPELLLINQYLRDIMDVDWRRRDIRGRNGPRTQMEYAVKNSQIAIAKIVWLLSNKPFLKAGNSTLIEWFTKAIYKYMYCMNIFFRPDGNMFLEARRYPVDDQGTFITLFIRNNYFYQKMSQGLAHGCKPSFTSFGQFLPNTTAH